MTIDRLVSMKGGEVKLLDIMKYPELLDLEVKLVESWETEENGYPNEHHFNEPKKMWSWITWLGHVASEEMGYTESDYERLISMNVEEV